MKNLRRRLRFIALLALLLAAVFLPAATGMAAAQSITTLFAANGGYAGNMFNITVLASADIQIDSFDINLNDPGKTCTVSVYYREGGYEGYESDAGAWTLAGSAEVISQGTDNPVHLPVGGITLTAGETYGLYISISSFAYTDPRLMYTTGNNTYADSNLQITCGAGKGYPDFTGSTYSMRTWNGTIYYALVPDIPRTGDPAGRLLWLYVPLSLMCPSGLVLLKRRLSGRTVN